MKTPLSASVAIVVGLLILLGYFLPFDQLQSLKETLVQWAVYLAAFALLVGVVNLVKVHWSKATRRKTGGLYSIILLVSLGITIVVAGYFGPTSSPSMWIFNNIQLPIEISLVALLAVILAVVGVRLLRRRPDLPSVIFFVTVLFVLMGTAPLFFVGEVPILSNIRDLIVQVPTVAGGRGILLGVALGTIATGIRIILGADRPYGG
jgi:hypothetical protein